MGCSAFLWALSRRLAIFRRNLQHYRGCKAQSGTSDVIYRALWGPCQHYRGFVQVGRCGTGTVRSGQKVDVKTRYFRTGACAVPEREARSVFGPAPPLAGVKHRGADCGHIYVRFDTSVFEFANTIEEARGRTAPCL